MAAFLREVGLNVAIVYDSSTGTTASAARAMADAFTARGHACVVSPVAGASAADVARADLICVGSWTQGLLVIGQHATAETMTFVSRLGYLAGKPAIVFCTYKIATGRMLPRLAAALRLRGAHVQGQFKFRGSQPTRDFIDFVGALPRG